LIAVEEGIREKTKSVIDAAYKKYDDKLPNRSRHEGRIVAVFDLMGNILGDHLRDSRLKGGKLFYPLFCAMYHMQYGLPKLSTPRKPIKTSSYPRIRIILEGIHELVEEWEAARKKHKDLELTADQRRFTAAYAEHWVHAANRTTLTQFICKRVMAG
jgi:hypothetical protein